MSDWDHSKSLLGTDRFVVERRLGEGSMGAVYLAYDREKRAQVALKTLRRVDALGIYRFKREFRALADLSHPNLVTLHELFSEGDQWFFTMEYVEGQDFLNYVLGTRGHGTLRTPEHGSDPWLLYESGGPKAASEPRIAGLEMLFPTPLADAERLRAVLVQIVEGLCAVHAAGKLHRDLKPDNVLVTAEGRAVLLDFGIVSDDESEVHRTLEPGVLGTPAYMSPEQAAGRNVDAASDFYALGAMMYEALTGTLPVDGAYDEVLERKQVSDPAPPSQIVSGVPQDLEQLCMSLLARDPKARPRGDAILRSLRSRRTVSLPAPARSTPPAAGDATPFVGRERELVELERAMRATDGGKPVLTLLSGPSGIGKTTLALRFIESLVERGQAVVLKGRCYERESVPFKAIDSLVDSLSRYLQRLPRVQVAEVLPRDVPSLSQLFPVLKRIEEVAQAKRRGALSSDPRDLRRRAFSALKELLCRIADRSPLVLFIDDLQWGDVDSAKLLAEILTGSDCPALLLLCAFRSGEIDTSPCLRTLLSTVRDAQQLDVRDLSLSGLSVQESEHLVRALSGTAVAIDPGAASLESRGSPYLLTELVRYVNEQGEPQARALTWEAALKARLRGLSKDARTLLQLVSVAGRPVPEDTLLLASAFDIDLQAALAELRAAKLVRGVATRSARAVETYHDRIREAVVAGIPADQLTVWHRRLASTLEASGSLDLEALTEHLLGAGEHARAGLYALRAAAQAERALAFDKAARLYAVAAAHHGYGEGDKRELLMRWGDALVNAGRGAQAARVYFEAAQLATGSEAAELRRKAGVQLLLGGRLEEGLEILRETLRDLGVELPADGVEARATLASLRAQLASRGLALDARGEHQIRVSSLRRLDALWAATMGLLVNEIDRPLPLVARFLLDALELGEPERVLRGACLYHAYIDAPLCALDRTPRLGALELAETLARGKDGDEARAWLAFARGAEHHHLGHFRAALTALEHAEQAFRAQGPAGAGQMRVCRQLMVSMYVAFALEEPLSSTEAWVREAEEREDLVVSTRLRLLTSFWQLFCDDPEAARRRCQEATSAWSRQELDVTTLAEWVSSCAIELYEGDHEACAQRAQSFSDFLDSPLAGVPIFRARVLLLRARAALCAAERAAEPSALLGRAAADAAAARGIGLECFSDHVRLIEAALAARRGDRAEAAVLLDEVLASPSAQEQPIVLASAWRRRGELFERGSETLIARADAMMREAGVRCPQRMVRLFAPALVPLVASR